MSKPEFWYIASPDLAVYVRGPIPADVSRDGLRKLMALGLEAARLLDQLDGEERKETSARPGLPHKWRTRYDGPESYYELTVCEVCGGDDRTPGVSLASCPGK